jgi:dihydrofolate synthase/folylpolyglutamate synthase
VVSPSVAVITGVGLDHTAILGGTPEQIAADKAAIIKPASAPVLGPGTDGLDAIFLMQAVRVGTHARAVREGLDFSPVAEDLTVRFRVIGRPERPQGTTELEVDGVDAHYGSLAMVAPSYQAANIATAVAAAEAALGRALDADRARTALASLTISGRFELVSVAPPVIVDGAHNPQAAAVLAGAIREAFPGRKPHVLIGVLADKDAKGIVEALAPVASGFSVVRPRSMRALSQDDLAAIVRQVSGTMPQRFATVPEALETLRGGCVDGLVVTGSLTTAGEARGVLLDASATGDV